MLVPEPARSGESANRAGERDDAESREDRDDRVWIFSSHFDGDAEWIDVEVCDGADAWTIEVAHTRPGSTSEPRRIEIRKRTAVVEAQTGAEVAEGAEAWDSPLVAERDELLAALARIAQRHALPPEVTAGDIADCAIECADAYDRTARLLDARLMPVDFVPREDLQRVERERDHLEGVRREQATKLRRHLDELAEVRAEHQALLARVDGEEAAGFVRGMETAQEWVEKAAHALRDSGNESDAMLLDDVATDLEAECDARVSEAPPARRVTGDVAGGAFSRCDDCGRMWTIVGGITQDGLGWVEGTAAHECDGIGALATFARGADGKLVIRDTFDVEEVGRLRNERDELRARLEAVGKLNSLADQAHAIIAAPPMHSVLRSIRANTRERFDVLGPDVSATELARGTMSLCDPDFARDYQELFLGAAVEVINGSRRGSSEDAAPVAAPTTADRPPPPYEDLDAGVRETVRWLFDHGFNPSDSGDGYSKRTDPNNPFFGLQGALDEPHVMMTVAAPELLSAEADRLASLLGERGVVLSGAGPRTPEEAEEMGVSWEPLPAGVVEGSLEGSYAPGGPAVIILTGVDDRALFGVIGAELDNDCDDGNPCTKCGP